VGIGGGEGIKNIETWWNKDISLGKLNIKRRRCALT